ncbi:hypothetical protein WJX73_005892 [Symbiochloris irregularis]|uniref:Uncharacterized protein n=1 Tax=Symbiochloris irregularis TaxID=706552 RepID=A0AAW1PIQ8_9CHLO
MPAHSVCLALVDPHTNTTTVVYDLVTGLPAALLLAFLAWRARPSLQKLRRSQSQIMATYYGFLWVVAVLGALRCAVQMAEVHASHVTLFNSLWLLTRFGLVLLEVSVVVFLLQGYITSGREALLRTLAISGAYAAFETLLAVLYIYGFHVPLFLYAGSDDGGQDLDMRWSKWGFWLVHNLLFLSVYGGILVLPYTSWRDRLPAKPSFYRYVLVLFVLNAVAAIGALQLGFGYSSGYCVYGAASWCYYAIFPLLLYMTFLAEFFLDDSLSMDLMYYSEMKDAGYLDDMGGAEMY